MKAKTRRGKPMTGKNNKKINAPNVVR